MKNFKIIMVIVVSLLVLVIMLQNTQSVETKLLFATITMPRAFLLFLAFLFGFVVGSISIATFSRKSKKLTNSKA